MSNRSSVVRVRAAEAGDEDTIHAMICALAEYERAPEQVSATPELIATWMFGDDPAAEVLIAELDDEPIGMALFYRTFSTWEGKPGIWLEDLFVYEAHRRAGAGRALMQRVAEVTLARGYTRLEWVALEWNTPALNFYDKLGAELMHEWRVLRVQGHKLPEVASAP